MILESPALLLMALPAAALLLRLRLASGRPTHVEVLRALVSLAAVLALSGPVLRVRGREGAVIVVADRSASMPDGADVALKETIDLLEKGRPEGARLGVVSFGEEPLVDALPQPARFGGFVTRPAREGSDLAAALRQALTLVPRGTSGRVLLLSDGRATGPDPATPALEAAARGVAVDFRILSRASAGDVAVDRIEAPESVEPGEGFLLGGFVRVPVAQQVSYELLADGRRLYAGREAMRPGLSRLLFRDRAEGPGTKVYELRVRGEAADPVRGNDVAKHLLSVRGARGLLALSPKGSALPGLLARGGVDVVARAPGQIDLSLDVLSGHAAVLIENLPASDLGHAGLSTLASWVSAHGGGLALTGGKSSYGPGGYFRGPIEPVLPVSMELRQEHRKLQVAIVVALDRSGSMAAPVLGNKVKMDLANLGTVQVLELLSPVDEMGVIAVDSSPHVVADLAPVGDRGIRSRILAIESMGGGIFVFEALHAAAGMIASARAATRHIVLFADAADAEEPGRYEELVESLVRAGVTVSVIGLGTPQDTDAELLRDIARRGGGNVYFTSNAEVLPSLFAQDTFLVVRSSFVEEPAAVSLTSGVLPIAGSRLGEPPPVGGYNLTYLRPGATLAAVTKDESEAPLLSYWRAGAGRVAAFTGEADGEFAGPFARWEKAGEWYASVVRWAMGGRDGEGESEGGSVALTQRIDGGVLHVELDAQGGALPAEPPDLTVLRGRPGEAPRADRVPMRFSGAAQLTAEVSIRGSETVLASLELPGRAGRLQLPPACLPYAPEYRPAAAGEGLAMLQRLARLSGGVERVTPSDTWRDLPREHREVRLATVLYLLAAALLLLEVLERRTGLLGAALALLARVSIRTARQRPAPSSPLPAGVPAPATPGKGEPVPGAADDRESAPSGGSLGEAMKAARKKARDRT